MAATDLPRSSGQPEASKAAAPQPADGRVGTAEGEEEQRQPMKHNDQQLQELLRLARSCLKYDRLPGEPDEQHYFHKFDSELAEQSKGDGAENLAGQSSDASAAGPSAALSDKDTIDATLGHLNDFKKLIKNKTFVEIVNRSTKDICEASSPPPQSSTDLPPDAATLRNLQTSQLERIAAKGKEALEAVTAELSHDILKRHRLEKEEKAVEEEFQKSQHQLRLAKDMVKRQNREIKDLHNYIQELQAAAASQSAPPSVVVPKPPPARPKAGQPRPGGRPLGQPGEPSPPPVAPAANAGAATAAVSTAGSSNTAEPGAGTAGPGQEKLDRPAKPAQPKPPSLASTIVLPPKSHTFSRILASRPKDDAWKLYIP